MGGRLKNFMALSQLSQKGSLTIPQAMFNHFKAGLPTSPTPKNVLLYAVLSELLDQK